MYSICYAVHLLSLILLDYVEEQQNFVYYVCVHFFFFFRLFGLTPIIETSCLYGATSLLVWDEAPVSYIVNPWALLGLYWLLGTDCQLWLATPVMLTTNFVLFQM